MPPTSTNKLCEWLVITMADYRKTIEMINYRNYFSKERITSNDEFCFKSLITKLTILGWYLPTFIDATINKHHSTLGSIIYNHIISLILFKYLRGRYEKV